MKAIDALAIALGGVLVIGCASDHDLNRDGVNFFGGGYRDRALAPGVYEIKAFANNLIMTTMDAAARTFENRAKGLCPSGFTELSAVEGSWNTGRGRPHDDVASKIGYIRCNDSSLTVREAQALVAPADHY